MKENEEKQEGKDIRLPENELSKEEQLDRSTRNTDNEYEAESPIDPYQEDPEEIVDRAQDSVDYAENNKAQESEQDENTRNDV